MFPKIEMKDFNQSRVLFGRGSKMEPRTIAGSAVRSMNLKRLIRCSIMPGKSCLILLICFLSASTVLAGRFEEDNSRGKRPAVPVGSCQPSNAISLIGVGKQVFSVIPKGSWLKPQNDVVLVNVEPFGVALARIPTTEALSSCASNSPTGQTVCTTNQKDVYVFSPPELKPSILQSGASAVSSFVGGACTTCGVAIDAIHNKALLSLSLLVPPPNTPPGNMAASGFQYIDLNGKPQKETAFRSEAPKAFVPGGEISKGILIDPIRNWILSPNESGNFEIIKVNGDDGHGNKDDGDTDGHGNKDNGDKDGRGNKDNGDKDNGDKDNKKGRAFFENGPIVDPQVPPFEALFASAAEECQTGIALATMEFSDPSEVYLVDLNKVGFTPGSPGSWPTPSSRAVSTNIQSLTGSSFSDSGSGPNGVAVAQGTSIGLLTGLMSSRITAFKLPESVQGKDPIRQYVTCQFPGMSGSAPHTLNAYQSPNTGHAMAVVGNDGETALWRIDLTEMLQLQSTNHVCNTGTLPPGLAQKIDLQKTVEPGPNH